MEYKGVEITKEDIRMEMAKRLSPVRFYAFLDYSQTNYERKWFHTLVAEKCQALIEGTLGKDKLMLFVPPQHGKSEIVSRKLPAWVLGNNPRAKIVGTSYSATLAEQFSRSIQRTMEGEEYCDLFPDTRINGKGWVRTADMFEVVGYGGYYKAVGVGGSLTGTPADLGIIDDPVKDSLEANSITYRNRVWDWYNDVFLTRLHNQSKQLLIMTRWHADDLAGRLLATEADEWEVLSIPAIKESNDDPNDPRKIGEALWEEKHSVNRLRDVEKRSPRTFASLYQQRPTIQGGNIVKEEWFKRISAREFNLIHSKVRQPMHFFLDTAYTNNTGNDPSGILAACKIGNELYITAADRQYLKFPDLCRYIQSWTEAHGYGNESTIRIEPKANGLSVIDQLREVTHLNVTKTPTPKESKETRLTTASVKVECGRIVLVDGAWVEGFIDEVCGFPSKPHDEYVDVLCYAIDYFLGRENNKVDIAGIARRINRIM